METEWKITANKGTMEGYYVIPSDEQSAICVARDEESAKRIAKLPELEAENAELKFIVEAFKETFIG